MATHTIKVAGLPATEDLLVTHLVDQLNDLLQRIIDTAGLAELKARTWPDPLRRLIRAPAPKKVVPPDPDDRTCPGFVTAGLVKTMPGPASLKFWCDMNQAVRAALWELGSRWTVTPGAFELADCRAYGTLKLRAPDGFVATIKRPRDNKIPAARFWPDRQIPAKLVLAPNPYAGMSRVEFIRRELRIAEEIFNATAYRGRTKGRDATSQESAAWNRWQSLRPDQVPCAMVPFGPPERPADWKPETWQIISVMAPPGDFYHPHWLLNGPPPESGVMSDEP